MLLKYSKSVECFLINDDFNYLYQELSFQDSEALGDVDEGADITGNIFHFNNILMSASCIRKYSIRNNIQLSLKTMLSILAKKYNL